MQKKLIALAMAAAFSAPAAAEVGFYGIVDATIANVSGSGQKSDLLAVSGGLSGSRLGVKATEDLGDGLKVVAVVEYGVDTEDSNGLGTSTARQKMLAVAGGFGTVATGFLQTTAYDWEVKFTPIGGSLISPLQSVTKGGGFLIGDAAAAARAQRAIAYISPKFGDFSFAVNYATALSGAGNLTQPDTATTGLKTSAMLLSGTYESGPLAVGGVYASTSNDNAGGATRSEMAAGVSYDLSVVKLMGTYQSSKLNTASSSDTALSFSAVLPVGNGAVIASIAQNSMGSTVGVDDNGSGMALAYAHTLSKDVTAYAAYESVKNGAATNKYSVGNNMLTSPVAPAINTMTLGGSSSLFGFGLRKKF